MEAYRSFLEDDDMLAMLLAERPTVVSFHFGVPSRERIEALHAAGIVLLGSATSLLEARALAAADVDAIVAQGYEAGGHRGVFDPDADDDRLGILALTRLLARAMDRPVIAAGGIMDGAGVAAALRLGASAAQLGYCVRRVRRVASRRRISRRPAERCRPPHGDDARDLRSSGEMPRESLHRARTRCCPARRARLSPIAYDAGKALHAAGKAKGEHGFGAQWAGQGAPLSRPMPAADLVALLRRETLDA